MATCSADSKYSHILLYPIKQLGRQDLISFESIYLNAFRFAISRLLRDTIQSFHLRHIYEERPLFHETKTSSRAVVCDSLSFLIPIKLN